ncbi:serine hydrolase domain-containing protein [Longimicrobium sp.]|uniref:serine hydrolase domain-containing protein n=1 Tax=Longimicrobium sp. TaxID=2029185 RepID=UPI002B90D418|nr:serine hydrolase domain-containing protein [Longimicrobium sp.]HSU12990.1 serine hydrolase domain-containing protein [Longimicrobium sp.]
MRFRPTALAVLLACASARPAAAQLVAFASAPGAGDGGASARLAMQLDSIARHAMEYQSIPGLSVVIVKDGRVVMERGYGVVNPPRERAATARTEYQIASVSKQFTAAAILRLNEQGRLSLDDAVTRYVDGLPPVYQEVTIRRLLNHTAGVPNFTEFLREFHQPLAPARLVEELASRTLQFAPGTAFHYSNSGYYLLGLVIEEVTGQGYADYLRDQFFTPLGLGDTHYCGELSAPVPAGFVRSRGGKTVRAAPWDPSVLYAAGSLCSTAEDLAKWEVALGEGRVLSPASFREMTTPAPPTETSVRMAYGYGMMVDTTEAGPYLHHDGAVSGFRAQVAWYPEEHMAIVVLMNQGLAAPEPIERDLARAVMGQARQREPRLSGPPTPTTGRRVMGSATQQRER